MNLCNVEADEMRTEGVTSACETDSQDNVTDGVSILLITQTAWVVLKKQHPETEATFEDAIEAKVF
jgi:hypothetical protein